MEIIIAIISISLLCGIGYLLYRRRIDNELVRIDVVEKEVDADARFFISAVYRSGRIELISPKALTEEQVYQESMRYMKIHGKKSS